MNPVLPIETPEAFEPLLDPKRYKGAKGGRGSGKSHFFAELAVEALVIDPNLCMVCIREIQRSLRYSAKRLIEAKIHALGVSHLFQILDNEIRCVGGRGIIIFQGMQDHTAETIKSIEDFDIAWVEEAQSLSSRSLRLLRPTIRAPGSQLWFSWNPNQPTDAVDELFGKLADSDPEGKKHTLVHVNYYDNPFLPDTLLEEMRQDAANDPDGFDHTWLGDYDTRSDAIIFQGKTKVCTFMPDQTWSGPYHGVDFGFAQDPTAAVQCWIREDAKGKDLLIARESGGVGIELDDTAAMLVRDIPGIEDYEVPADSARPECISYLQRHGLPFMHGVNKWTGSVKDGIDYLRTFRCIYIHEDCREMQSEARRYKYKVDKKTEQILPVPVDAHNHYWDAVRYALNALIQSSKGRAGLMLQSKYKGAKAS